MRVGVVVNPIAGMGGRVGLKGTDGKVAEARARGAEPRAPDRTIEALEALHDHAPDATVLTWGALMGASEARAAGFEPDVLGDPGAEETTAADTRRAVRAFVDAGVDLILFVGGDGTAQDVVAALEAADALEAVPALGVPAGVKIFSSVFAYTPREAGRIAATFERTEHREVMDIDEEAYREGEVKSELRGVLRVPVGEEVQSSKQLAGGTIESLADGFADDVEPDVTYVLGPGGTLQAIKRALGFAGTPLGVDVYRDGEVLARDADEATILAHLGEENVVVVSPIGGQGVVFGRGNQQISPAVIRRSAVEVVASREKLDTIGVLHVDTGDEAVDASLRGWRQVRIGRFERRMMKVV